MNFNQLLSQVSEKSCENLWLSGPEMLVVGCLVALFLFDAAATYFRHGRIPMVIIILTCTLGIWMTHKLGTKNAVFFFGFLKIDGLTTFFRYFFFVTTILAVILAYGSKELNEKSRSEFSILLVATLFGMLMMAEASHLLLLYLGIETVSIVSFVLAGFGQGKKSNEASFKYFAYGAMSSALMLYGISLIYGITGELEYPKIAQYLGAHILEIPRLLIIGLVLLYAGFAYKIAAFPMHFWAPDIYEGAPTPVAAFFSIGPKAAGFAALIRFLVDGLSVPSPSGLQLVTGPVLLNFLALTATITMFVGNLSAIAQTSVKRLLAYSSIAHVGYLLMGLVTLNASGLEAILFYLVVYCAMNFGAFWTVSMVVDYNGRDTLAAFRGMGWKMPCVGTCMAIFLFSLTGIPFFAGFVGKFLLFGAILQVDGFLWLALVGVLNSVISLYYYTKIIKAMWFDTPDAEEFAQIPSNVSVLPIIGLAIPTIVLGLFFGPVVEFTRKSVELFLTR